MPQRLIAAVEDDRSVEERADREHWDIAICRFLTGVATARVVPVSSSAAEQTAVYYGAQRNSGMDEVLCNRLGKSHTHGSCAARSFLPWREPRSLAGH